MEQETLLFDDLEDGGAGEEQTSFTPVDPIWSESKARLIERYLHFFTFVTKHGTYFDAFAGPQRMGCDEMWSAKLVLESRPRRLRNFHLFEINPASIEALRALRCAQPPTEANESKRHISIHPGDCNERMPEFLASHPVKNTEAAFCLFDQRTFECDWATVEAVARHKKGGNKIELFYFLANGWIERAKAGKSDQDQALGKWWGGPSWREFFKLPRAERGRHFRKRFIDELGYGYATPYPIYEKADGGKTMYWMIHATDYSKAPELMHRAYKQVLNITEVAHEVPLFDPSWGAGLKPAYD